MTALPLRAPLAIEPPRALVELVLAGLRATPRTLPPALFYDARGAALFEAITALPEYYLTRTELSILTAQADALAARLGPRVALIEPGSGAMRKVRPLLAALHEPVAYVPIDVSREQLVAEAAALQRAVPSVTVTPVWGDYTEALELPPLPAGARRVVFFPGSTIGNLHPHEASALLRRLREAAGPDGGLLLGVDRRKDPRRLNAAYNDAAGVTAEFNLNVLAHLNRAFGGTFDRAKWAHRAFFAPQESRIEMHLEAVAPQAVEVAGERFDFALGETIRTEVSYKYDRPRLETVAEAGGWRVVELFTDARDWFWLAWLEAA